MRTFYSFRSKVKYLAFKIYDKVYSWLLKLALFFGA